MSKLNWKRVTNMASPTYVANGVAGNYDIVNLIADRDIGYGRSSWFVCLNGEPVEATTYLRDAKAACQATEDDAAGGAR